MQYSRSSQQQPPTHHSQSSAWSEHTYILQGARGTGEPSPSTSVCVPANESVMEAAASCTSPHSSAEEGNTTAGKQLQVKPTIPPHNMSVCTPSARKQLFGSPNTPKASKPISDGRARLPANTCTDEGIRFWVCVRRSQGNYTHV